VLMILIISGELVILLLNQISQSFRLRRTSMTYVACTVLQVLRLQLGFFCVALDSLGSTEVVMISASGER
jgi:hypothetical protein